MPSASRDPGRNDRLPFTIRERLIRSVAQQVNHRPLLKQTSHALLRTIGAGWVHFCSRNLLRVSNAEVLDRFVVGRDRGVVVTSNHRSYFDMYVLSSVLLRRCPWIRRMYFPVRSDYFYEQWGGLSLNLLLSGLAMYPPIYRDAVRRTLNRDAVDFVVHQLGRPGTVVGLHPEGRRNTGDPYTLLPAHPGLGEIVHRARPLVLPVFIGGMPGDLRAALHANFFARPSPITITVTFGEPLSLDAYRELPAGPRTSLRIARAISAEIERLGALERNGVGSPFTRTLVAERQVEGRGSDPLDPP